MLTDILSALIVLSAIVFVMWYLPLLAKDTKKIAQQNQEIINLLKELKETDKKH